MVDYVVGTVQTAQNHEIIVNIGIMGIVMQVPNGHIFEKNSPIKICSYLHWNSENGPSLFGFSSIMERTVFHIIINCSGIGPKIGLAILAELGAQTFLHAISTNNDQMLSKVTGIGKKKAEQIIVSAKHKVATLIDSGAVDMSNIQTSSDLQDVSLALQTLNYSRPEIGRAMDYLKKNITLENMTFDALLRQALSYLSKQI